MQTCSTKCGNEARSFKRTAQKYGVENFGQLQSVKDKIKETNLTRYGVEYANQSKQVKDKIKQTNLERYGVESLFLDRDYVKKCMLNKHNVDNPFRLQSVKDEIKNTSLKRYGVEHHLQNPDILSKQIKTNLEKYGAENPMQNQDIYDKSTRKRFKLKEFAFPSGKIVKCQGYEPQALAILLEKYEENDIIVDNKEIENLIGKIMYTDENGKRRRYFPDIYIKSKNMIIEVKSTWTYSMNEEENILKRQACLNKGLQFEFKIIYSV